MPRCKESVLSTNQLLKAQSHSHINWVYCGFYVINIPGYIKKSNGQVMKHCSTPQGTILGLGKVPFISTFWVQFVKYESSKETEISLSPKARSLSDNKEWFTVSKGFRRSFWSTTCDAAPTLNKEWLISSLNWCWYPLYYTKQTYNDTNERHRSYVAFMLGRHCIAWANYNAIHIDYMCLLGVIILSH